MMAGPVRALRRSCRAEAARLLRSGRALGPPAGPAAASARRSPSAAGLRGLRVGKGGAARPPFPASSPCPAAAGRVRTAGAGGRLGVAAGPGRERRGRDQLSLIYLRVEPTSARRGGGRTERVCGDLFEGWFSRAA